MKFIVNTPQNSESKALTKGVYTATIQDAVMGKDLTHADLVFQVEGVSLKKHYNLSEEYETILQSDIETVLGQPLDKKTTDSFDLGQLIGKKVDVVVDLAHKANQKVKLTILSLLPFKVAR